MTTYGSRYAKRERDVQDDDSPSSSDSEVDDEQIIMMSGDKGDNFFKPIRGEPGIAYKVHTSYANGIRFTLVWGTGIFCFIYLVSLPTHNCMLMPVSKEFGFYLTDIYSHRINCCRNHNYF